MKTEQTNSGSSQNQIIDDYPYSITQAGHCIGFKTTKVYSLLNERKIKAIKLGAKTRIMGSELRRFLNSAPAYKEENDCLTQKQEG